MDENEDYQRDYELSANQQQFVNDAEEQGFEVDYSYSGRCMYGRECPSVVVEGIADFSTKAKYSFDNMGLDYVIYAPN